MISSKISYFLLINALVNCCCCLIAWQHPNEMYLTRSIFATTTTMQTIQLLDICKGAQHTCALDAVHCQYLGNLLYKMGCVPPIFETL